MFILNSRLVKIWRHTNYLVKKLQHTKLHSLPTDRHLFDCLKKKYCKGCLIGQSIVVLHTICFTYGKNKARFNCCSLSVYKNQLAIYSHSHRYILKVRICVPLHKYGTDKKVVFTDSKRDATKHADIYIKEKWQKLTKIEVPNLHTIYFSNKLCYAKCRKVLGNCKEKKP